MEEPYESVVVMESSEEEEEGNRDIRNFLPDGFSPNESFDEYTIVGVSSTRGSSSFSYFDSTEIPSIETLSLEMDLLNIRNEENSSVISSRSPFSNLPPPPPADIESNVPSTPYYSEEDAIVSEDTVEEENSKEEMEKLHKEVVDAAIETSKNMLFNNDEFRAMLTIFQSCQCLSSESKLRKLLTQNRLLACCRSSNLDNLAPNGSLPLHICAAFNNIAAMKIFLEFGASVWVRDLSGKTPLHIAAKNGHIDSCIFLRERMKEERGKDPIGKDAPIDLSGSTPLGWASFNNKNRRVKQSIHDALFSPGDKSILPITPHKLRSGQTPRKFPGLEGKEDHVFAFSKAQNWTAPMEDRIVVVSPVASRSDWSLFGVFDGHGGSYCSQYLADHIPNIFHNILKEFEAKFSGAKVVGSSECNNHDVTKDDLHQLLEETCLAADAELQRDPRMKVTISAVSGAYTAYDSSGSTGVLMLVTEKYLAIANVGDSRAIMGYRSAATQATSPTHSGSHSMSPTSSSSSSSSCRNNNNNDNNDNNNRQLSDNNNLNHSNCNSNHPSNPSDAANSLSESSGIFLSSPATCRDLRPSLASSLDFLNSPAPNKAFLEDLTRYSVLKVAALSEDHKFSTEEERQRAVLAGATVSPLLANDTTDVVTGHEVSLPNCPWKLRMSRSFGDFYLKMNENLTPRDQAVIAVPDIVIHERNERDGFVVLACDGIWDVLSNQEVCNFFSNWLGFTASSGPVGGISQANLAEAADALLQLCESRNSNDNLSCIVVAFGRYEGMAKRRRSSAGQILNVNHRLDFGKD